MDLRFASQISKAAANCEDDNAMSSSSSSSDSDSDVEEVIDASADTNATQPLTLVDDESTLIVQSQADGDDEGEPGKL